MSVIHNHTDVLQQCREYLFSKHQSPYYNENICIEIVELSEPNDKGRKVVFHCLVCDKHINWTSSKGGIRYSGLTNHCRVNKKHQKAYPSYFKKWIADKKSINQQLGLKRLSEDDEPSSCESEKPFPDDWVNQLKELNKDNRIVELQWKKHNFDPSKSLMHLCCLQCSSTSSSSGSSSSSNNSNEQGKNDTIIEIGGGRNTNGLSINNWNAHLLTKKHKQSNSRSLSSRQFDSKYTSQTGTISTTLLLISTISLCIFNV